MDKIKSAYGHVMTAHGYAVGWVYAHPAATVNSILAAVALRIAIKAIF